MRILKIIHGYPMRYNAGSEVYSQSICNELSRAHTVHVFTREEDPFRPDFVLRSETDAHGVTLHLINMPRAKDGYRHAEVDRALDRLLEIVCPEVAHIGHLNHLSTGIVDVLHARGIPIVFTLHDFWLMCPRGQFLQRNFDGKALYELCDGQSHEKCATSCYSMHFSGRAEAEGTDLKYWSQWIEGRMSETRALCEKVHCFIAPSQYLLSRFVQDFRLNPASIRYLDYGFPSEYLRYNDTAELRKEFTFGYIGTHIPAKGIYMLIEAFSRLQGNALLRIWGRNSAQNTDALKALADRLVKLPLRVEWMGEYVNRNIAREVFQFCDTIVVPSVWGENSPLVIHEAQACRVPVITADFGGMAEYVQHAVNGLLFTHRDTDALSRQMQWALEHPDSMRQLGQRGYLLDAEGQVPDIVTHCGTLVRIYQELIQRYGA